LILILFSSDLVTLYLGLEGFALTSVLLVSYGATVREQEVGLIYFFVNLFASLLFLSAFALLYYSYGSLSYESFYLLNLPLQSLPPIVNFALLLFTLSLFVKVGFPPFSI
jgi:formate hydrogenlyase subunit 3/multisubunit Na+/H+ antiporter MnhD subunit